MSDPTDSLWVAPDSNTWVTYRVAGRPVRCNTRCPEMAAFLTESDSRPPPAIDVPSARGPRTFSGLAHLARGRWTVDARASGDQDWISIPGLGELYVRRDGQVVFQPATPDLPMDERILTALAPGLALSWCRKGLWLLHASAIRAPNGGLVLLMGRSGAGKSTLAGAFGSRRMADDCVPVRVEDARVAGRFPQPKLADFAGGLEEGAVIEALIELDPDPAPGIEQLRPLRPAESLTALIRHTVAAVLLGPQRMLTHLTDCRRLAEAIPCYRLVYRQSPERIPALIEVIDRQWPA